MCQDYILKTIMLPFNLTNIIKEVTCYKSNDPTLIDDIVMLVTKCKCQKYVNSFSVNTGISVHHNMIGGILRVHKLIPEKK